MSIASEISRIQQAKASIKTAIEGKGVYVPSSAYLDDYPSYIEEIEGGGGSSINVNGLIDRSIEEIEIPENINTIGDYAFCGCQYLSSVTIPDLILYIGNGAFMNCTSLESLTIPDSVSDISYSAFTNCTSLESINIPDGLTSISDCCFKGCSSLSSITIPSTVEYIFNDAFNGCRSLSSITIPSAVTLIDYDAFFNCSSLEEIYIEAETPPSLGSSPFENTNDCPIYVPSTSLNDYLNDDAWADYSDRLVGLVPKKLKGVDIYDEEYSIDCNASTSITSAETSSYRSTMASAVIGNCVTSIGSKAFSGCTNLSSVTIPDSVTDISHSGFTNCSSLESVVIPSGVTAIGTFAFSGCSSLQSVTILATTPPTVSLPLFWNAFQNTNDCPIYVPSGSVSTYQSASGWSTYASRIQAIPSS